MTHLQESDVITVTVRRDDVLCLVLGPLDYAIKKMAGEVSGDASVMRLRQTLARALEEQAR